MQRGAIAWRAILGSTIRSIGIECRIALTSTHQEENYEASDDAKAD